MWNHRYQVGNYKPLLILCKSWQTHRIPLIIPFDRRAIVAKKVLNQPPPVPSQVQIFRRGDLWQTQWVSPSHPPKIECQPLDPQSYFFIFLIFKRGREQ